jgi:hypothetical protein
MNNVVQNRELLKINMFWMLVIYIALIILAFHFSVTLGIIASVMSIGSYVFYIILGKKIKKLKNMNETNMGSN